MVVGLPLRGVRVFKRFAWLEAGSGKVALSRPTHQRVTRAVGRLEFFDYEQPQEIASNASKKCRYTRMVVLPETHFHLGRLA